MEWFSEWIRQIILLVLIATFIDLLLPNQSFDRYVKLVMGLLIIMAILSPILGLLNEELDFSRLTKWQTHQSIHTANMDSLQEIEGKSKQLSQLQTTQIEKEWAENMEQIIQQQLTKQFHLQDVEVMVKTQIRERHTSEIQRIEVQARYGKSDDPNTSTRVKPIESMEPVQVELESQKNGKKEYPIYTKVRKYIVQTWHIPVEQIDVQIEPS